MAWRLLQVMGVVEANLAFYEWGKYMMLDKATLDAAMQAEVAEHDFNAAEAVKGAKEDPISSVALDKLVIPRPEWIIRKVIPKGGLVAISGVPGSFKSYFALWIALRAAEGLPLFKSMETEFFCDQITEKTPTLFIEEENTLPLVHTRHRSFCTPRSADLFFHIDKSFKLIDEAWRNSILAFVEAHKIGLIIMDPFSSVMGFEDENDNAKVSVQMDLMRKQFIMKGVTVIFLHHPSKNSEGGVNLRGAGDILGKCDVHLHLEKDEIDKNLITVAYKKMRLISETEVSDFKMRAVGDGEIGQLEFRYMGEAIGKREEGINEKMKEILAAFIPGEAMQKNALSKATGGKQDRDPFKGAFERLVKDGKIRIGFEKKFGQPTYLLS
jgi:hypothetical protein